MVVVIACAALRCACAALWRVGCGGRIYACWDPARCPPLHRGCPPLHAPAAPAGPQPHHRQAVRGGQGQRRAAGRGGGGRGVGQLPARGWGGGCGGRAGERVADRAGRAPANSLVAPCRARLTRAPALPTLAPCRRRSDSAVAALHFNARFVHSWPTPPCPPAGGATTAWWWTRSSTWSAPCWPAPPAATSRSSSTRSCERRPGRTALGHLLACGGPLQGGQPGLRMPRACGATAGVCSAAVPALRGAPAARPSLRRAAPHSWRPQVPVAAAALLQDARPGVHGWAGCQGGWGRVKGGWQHRRPWACGPVAGPAAAWQICVADARPPGWYRRPPLPPPALPKWCTPTAARRRSSTGWRRRAAPPSRERPALPCHALSRLLAGCRRAALPGTPPSAAPCCWPCRLLPRSLPAAGAPRHAALPDPFLLPSPASHMLLLPRPAASSTPRLLSWRGWRWAPARRPRTACCSPRPAWLPETPRCTQTSRRVGLWWGAVG